MMETLSDTQTQSIPCRLSNDVEPFRIGLILLQRWLDSQSCQDSCSCTVLRAEVPVDHDIDPLQWIRAQTMEEKMYFKCRRESVEVACVRFAKKSQGKVYTEETHRQLASLLPSASSLRFYGGLRFDSDYANPSQEWKCFSGYTFVLPMLELQRFNDGTACLSINLMNNQPSKELASDTMQDIVMPPDFPLTLYIPQPIFVDNVDTYEKWCANMSNVLRDMVEGKYKKIVLARRKRFCFEPRAHIDPIDVLEMLARDARRSPECETHHPRSYATMNGSGDECTGSNSSVTETAERRHNENHEKKGKKYFFYLQLSKNSAFVSSTPECLFHKKGRRIETESLAGTVKYGPHDTEELLSNKNIEEHQYVVDFLKTALTECHASAETDGPHILRLPRLMHLKTDVRGLIKEGQKASCTLDALLRRTHPTPAVCGYPQALTKSVLREIEGFDRGFYGGPVGWFSSDESEFCVAIRSALISGSSLTAYAGCGIVQASNSKAEWDETELKLSSFVDYFERPKASQSPERNQGISEWSHTHYNSHRLQCLPNLNTLWGFCVVEELLRHGVDHFFVSPGSRSTPLVVGVELSREAKLLVIHDERVAAFAALGYARGTGKPAAVITTSGTAVANLLPATVEASNDCIPLILLTADRPPELRDVGANQSIDQVRIFGNYCRWFKDTPCSSVSVPLRNLLSDVDYAVSMAGSLSRDDIQNRPGPVHINFMFREKLAPCKVRWDRRYIESLSSWSATSTPLVRNFAIPCRSEGFLCSRDIREILCLVTESQRGMILVGNNAVSTVAARRAILKLAKVLGWPIIADVASGIRFGPKCAYLMEHADLLFSSARIRTRFSPDVILQLKGRFTSKRVHQVIEQAGGKLSGHILVSEIPTRDDEHFSVTHRVATPVSAFALQLLECVTRVSLEPAGNGSTNRFDRDLVRNGFIKNDCVQKGEIPFTRGIMRSKLMDLVPLSSFVSQILIARLQHVTSQPIEEPLLATCLTGELGSDEALFVSNSMPIRDLDTFGLARRSSAFTVAANRGASGIDGILASALGFCIGSERKTTVYIGDMATIHDLNTLHLLRTFKGPRFTVIVLNNSGGGIFSMLPIAKHKQFYNAMNSPHCLKFGSIAQAFGIQYQEVHTVGQFKRALHVSGSKPRIIEAQISPHHSQNAKSRNSLVQDIVCQCEANMFDSHN